jgi:hypothetical protein
MLTYGKIWPIMTKLASVLSVPNNFGKLCQVLPYVTRNIKSGEKYPKMVNNDTTYLFTKYD